MQSSEKKKSRRVHRHDFIVDSIAMLQRWDGTMRIRGDVRRKVGEGLSEKGGWICANYLKHEKPVNADFVLGAQSRQETLGYR